MDIKDWILVGGGLLLIAVIGHGFWLAWRSRRDTLKIDIDPNIPRGDVDDLDLLRAELPNGGARVRMNEPIEQTDLALEPVVSATVDKPAQHREPFVAQRKTQPGREPVVKHKEAHKESKARPIVPERPRERGREATRAVPQPIQTRPAEKHEDRRRSNRADGIPIRSARSHHHQRAGAQRRQVRRHRSDGGIPAQRPQVRRHEHLPSHPAGVEGSAVQRGECGGARYVRPVCDGSRSGRPA